MKYGLRILLVSLALAILGGCKDGKGKQMDKMETVTHCVGRHKIDLPAGFVLMTPSSSVFMPAEKNPLDTQIDLQVVSAGMKTKDFDEEITRYKLELGGDGDGLSSSLKAAEVLAPHEVLFRVLRVQENYWSELNVLKDGSLLRARANSYHGTYKEVESFLQGFSRNIVPASLNGAEGFCLGPVAVLGKNKFERGTFAFHNPRQPDVAITIDVNSYTKNPEPLLSRMDGPDSLLRKFDLKHRVLRKGNVKVANMDAQEWLGAARLGEDNHLRYNFALETQRPDPGPEKPFIRIEMKSGDYDAKGDRQPNSLTDETAIQMWDTVVHSIRVR